MNNGYRQTCHCSHDRASHAIDDQQRGARCACLCTGCDCPKYINENNPPPPKVLRKPRAHKHDCQCYDCKAAAAASAPKTDTLPMPASVPPAPYDPYGGP